MVTYMRNRSPRVFLCLDVAFLRWFVFLIVASIVAGAALTGCRGRHKVPERVSQLNYPAILDACRGMISNRQIYAHSDLRIPSTLPAEVIVLRPELRPLDESVPTLIRDLNANEITIAEDHVCLWLDFRVLVLGFADGAKQFGTEKLIDGLWYFDGYVREDERARVSTFHK